MAVHGWNLGFDSIPITCFGLHNLPIIYKEGVGH